MMTGKFNAKIWSWLGFISLAALTFGCVNQQSSGKHSSSGSKPNIILIMADDLGRSELGSYGQQIIRTPNLDRMAEEGIRFTNFYAGSTVCAPSRNVLMTGRHTGHTYVRGNFHTGSWPADLALPDTVMTIAEYMKEAGYRTAMMGKWGLGDEPNEQGFDYTLAYLDQIDAHSYYPPHLWENQQKLPLKGNQNEGRSTYSHNVFVDKTLEYIENSNTEEPFFLYLPYSLPHGQFEISDDAPYSNEDWPQQKKNIAAMITLLDQDVGRIIQLLRDKGIAENTVVFFTSDNGPTGAGNRYFNSNGPLKGIKRDLYEGGIRVPLIAWWPETIRPGQTSNHIAAAWDFLPTIAELAGAEVHEPIDGISFLPELLGEKQSEHKFLYWEYYHYNWTWGRDDYDERPRNWLQSRAVRYGQWKVVENNIPGDVNSALELYNLSTDIGEEHNVADEHSEIVRKIQNYISDCCSVSPHFPNQK